MAEEKFVNKIKTKDGSEYDIQDKRLDEVESGSIQDALGLNSSGKLVKGAISGGTKLYSHLLEFSMNTEFPQNPRIIVFITNFNTPITQENINSLLYDPVGLRNDKVIAWRQRAGSGVISIGVPNAGYVLSCTEIKAVESVLEMESLNYPYIFGDDTVTEL